MRVTLLESGIAVKAEVRALHGNHQIETGIEKTIQKRTVKGTSIEIEIDFMIWKVKGGDIGSETVVKRVEAGKGMTMTGIEVESEIRRVK